MSWLVPFKDLAPAQRELVEAGLDRHLIVEGPAGSGKTALLLHRAAALRARHPLSPGRLRIFCYTRILKQYLGSSLELLGLPAETLSTFDAWCLEVFRTHVRSNLPIAYGQTDLQVVRDGVEQFLLLKESDHKLLDVALVDEGQDFPPQVFRILSYAAHHVTVVLDPQQRIYAGGATPGTLAAELGCGRQVPSHRLDSPFRCSREVATFALTFMDDPGERLRTLGTLVGSSGAGQLPLTYFGKNQADQDARTLSLIRQRMGLGERVGILLPQTRLVHQMADRLRGAGIPVELALPAKGRGLAEADFGSLVPKACTYHSAKGLSFDSVFLPWLENASFDRDQGPSRRRLLFVALTRASHWTYLGRCQEAPFDEDPWLEAAARSRTLMVQHFAPTPATGLRGLPGADRFRSAPISIF